ncbi:MAG: acylneuraminate cytidylyltransferase family protein [Pseudomonadota bacterium]
MTFDNRPVVALVPARSGSKGVPGKNLRVIKGKPLLKYTVQAALESEVVDTVYVSSDDVEILALSRLAGAVALRRPAAAASDTATATLVVLDFIGQLPLKLVEEDPFIVYLQPTSPLRTGAHIDRAFSNMADRKGSASLSVVPLRRSPYKSFSLTEEGMLQSLFEEALSNSNRQDLPETYYPNGALYIFQLTDFMKTGGFPSNGSVPFIMSEKESIDIDIEDDIALLEALWPQN